MLRTSRSDLRLSVSMLFLALCLTASLLLPAPAEAAPRPNCWDCRYDSQTAVCVRDWAGTTQCAKIGDWCSDYGEECGPF